MRIRTDGDHGHRQRTIDRATEFYGSSKTRAMLSAAEDVRGLAEAVEEILARDDLTLAQRREIAATFDAAVSWRVDVEKPPVSVEPDG